MSLIRCVEEVKCMLGSGTKKVEDGGTIIQGCKYNDQARISSQDNDTLQIKEMGDMESG